MGFQLSLSGFGENGKGRWYPMGFQLIPQLCSRRGAAITSVGSPFVIGTISSYSVHFVRLFSFHLLRWYSFFQYPYFLLFTLEYALCRLYIWLFFFNFKLIYPKKKKNYGLTIIIPTCPFVAVTVAFPKKRGIS